MWSRSGPVERAGYLVGGLLLISGLVHVAILLIGGGTWSGPLSLRKPATFGLSFGLTLITVVWVASFLRLRDRERTVLLSVFTAACVIETALVSLQAWRGVPSHYNVETAFDALVARTLAVGGFALILVIVWLTRAAFRDNETIPASLRIALRVGFVTLCGALAVGALMIAKGMALVFAGDPQAAYATGGTLKPTHAVTMHGILALPALAWLLSRTGLSQRRQVRLVLCAAAAYVAAVGVVAMENVVGFASSQPLLVAVTIGALTLLTAGTIVSVRR